MPTKSKIKFVKSLKLKKNRDSENAFVVEGIKAVNEFLDSDFDLKYLFATKDYDNIFEVKNIEGISQKELEQISFQKNPNRVLAVFYKKKPVKLDLEKGLILALDSINDPGNFGTIIRTSAWFGVQNIVCSENSVDLYNPKVVQSSMGALKFVNIFYANLSEIFANYKHNIYGAFLEGKDISHEKLTENAVILMGNEANGIGDENEKICTNKISIKGSGVVESLNLSIATGIILDKFCRIKY